MSHSMEQTIAWHRELGYNATSATIPMTVICTYDDMSALRHFNLTSSSMLIQKQSAMLQVGYIQQPAW